MDNIINAELPHPEIQGPPLYRGTRYGHHFVVELVSDGRRLWAVASEEGRKILHEIAHGLDPEKAEAADEKAKAAAKNGPTIAEWVEAGYPARKYPPSGYPSISTQDEIDAAIKVQDEKEAADLAAVETAKAKLIAEGANSGTGTEPVPNQSGTDAPNPSQQQTGADAPTTTTASANTFDS